MTIHQDFARFAEPAPQPTTFNLIPYEFDELELFPGVICQGTAHFDTNRHGDWSVSQVDLKGLKGPDMTVSNTSKGDTAVIFRLIAATLRNQYEEHILGSCIEEA